MQIYINKNTNTKDGSDSAEIRATSQIYTNTNTNKSKKQEKCGNGIDE